MITPAATPPVIHKVKSMILGSGKTLGSSTKSGGGAKIVKPVFTVGRGDGPSTKNVGKGMGSSVYLYFMVKNVGIEFNFVLL